MESIDILDVAKKWGSPCYLFRSKDFCDNFVSLINSFRRYYSNYIPAYSYKTNYTPYICKLVKQMGGYAEVVSDMELYLAQKLGYEPNKIIYNGPNKGHLMEAHILHGGVVNIDNITEAKRVAKIAKQNPQVNIRIGIRINTNVGAGFISRFGVDTSSYDLEEVLLILKSSPNIHLSGLHLHVSRARGLEAWQRRIKNILSIADRLFETPPDYIDVGSGMFADMEDSLKSQFSIDVPSYDEYALVVAGEMASRYGNMPNNPILFTEPGTTVVSRYMSLITTVCGVKSIQKQNYAIVDSDIHNAGETCLYMRLPYTIFRPCEHADIVDNPDVVGYTCLEQDCIYKNFPESLSVGDVIEFRNVGGYSIVYKPPFILPNCRMIATTHDGSLVEIKRAESFDDVFRTFVF